MDSNSIEITGVDLKKFVQKAYELSQPQGLGFLHYEKGALTDDEAQGIIDSSRPDGRNAVSMDYVKGRSIKMHVSRDDGKLFIYNNWYDHSPHQLKELLIHCGFESEAQKVAA